MYKIKYLNGTEKEFKTLNGADLSGANLHGAELGGADLVKAKLVRANLRGAHLEGAHLVWANLEGAHLVWANLEGANLHGANLEGANLGWANLYKTNLEVANLCGADLPSPTMLLMAQWEEVSDKLCTLLMKYDSSNHPKPELFIKWKLGGGCPYDDVRVGRAANFNEKRSLYDPDAPLLSAFELMKMVIVDKCEDSDYHGEE